MQILLSNSQAEPDKTVKQEQEEISRNHVQAFFPGPVQVKLIYVLINRFPPLYSVSLTVYPIVVA